MKLSKADFFFKRLPKARKPHINQEGKVPPSPTEDAYWLELHRLTHFFFAVLEGRALHSKNLCCPAQLRRGLGWSLRGCVGRLLSADPLGGPARPRDAGLSSTAQLASRRPGRGRGRLHRPAEARARSGAGAGVGAPRTACAPAGTGVRERRGNLVPRELCRRLCLQPGEPVSVAPPGMLCFINMLSGAGEAWTDGGTGSERGSSLSCLAENTH